jgi:ribonuclease VapC
VTVLDSSALLAFLQGEPGADQVEDALVAGAICGTANWSEVAQKVLAHGRDWSLAAAVLHSYDLELAPVTVADAEHAARQWRPGEGLSLGDRLCLALAGRVGRTVLTADRAWPASERVRQIR